MRLLLTVTFALALFVPDGAEEGRRGNELFRQGDYARAIRAYRQGLARMPADPDPVRAGLYNNLGMAQYQQKEFAEARQAFNDGMAAATTTDGKSRLAYNAGNASYREKQLEEALAYYRAALLSNPDNENAKFNYEYVKRRLNNQGQGNKQSQDSQNSQNQNQQQQDQQQRDGQQNQNRQENQDQPNQQDQQRQQNQQQQQQNKQNQQPRQDQQQQQQGQQDQQQEQGTSNSGRQQTDGQQSQGGEQQAGREQRKVSQEEALRILQALENSEENLLRQMSPRQEPEDQDVEKDW